MTPPLRSRPPSLRTRWLFLLIAFALLSGRAVAHNPISSSAILDLQRERMELKVEMASESAWLFLGETLDRAPDVAGSLPRLRSAVPQSYALSINGRVLVPQETSAELEDDAVVLRLVYERPNSGPLHCDALYLQRLPADHRSTLTLLESQQSLRTDLLNASKHAVDFTLPAQATAAPAPGPATSPPVPPPSASAVAPSVSVGDFFKLGIEHILTGYDHLLFLLGLLVVCRRWSSMLTIITCFTLAHSLTLALAALNVVSIPSRVVEPLIAASIVFVGVENLLRRDEPKGRWLLTFIFGLIHGFGFAGVLREIGLGAGGASVALPLFSFNLGVEAGQLAVVAILLPVLLALRRRPSFVERVEPCISGIVVILGAYWLLQRTALA
jgi:hydrogenase/urease accessory protein HupE